MSEVIKIGNYHQRSVTIPKLKDITTDDVEKEIARFLSSHATYEEKDGPLETGDVAVFDFQGKKHGKTFPGGSAENYELKIGSHQFIPGFEEQMVGMKKEKTYKMKCRFPENYHEPSLAGQNVIFTVVVHQIKKPVIPVLSDEFVEGLNLPDTHSAEDFHGYIWAQLYQKARQEQTVAKENAVFDLLLAESEVALKEEDINKALDAYVGQLSLQLNQQGLTMDQYLQATGMNMNALRNQLRNNAKQQAKFEALIDEVVRRENIDTNDDEIDEQAQLIADNNHMTREMVFQQISRELFKKDINRLKAAELIIADTNFKEV